MSAERAVRGLLLSDFTIDGLAVLLRAGERPPRIEAAVAPFGQARPLLLDRGHECWRREPEVALVWTRPQSIKAFASLLDGEAVATEEILAEVDGFAAALRAAAERVKTILVPTWTLPPEVRGRGPLSMRPASGVAYHLMRMNTRLAEALAAEPGVHVLDAGRWMASVGARATSPKLWHMGKIAFSPEVFALAAADVKAAIRAVQGRSRKLVLVDLDDTLWGGVVGDVGWRNLNLGGHDPAGEAFVELQRALAALARRGVVLGILSKNTEAVALEAIDEHPEMVLRREHFAGWRIDWGDKARNLVELAGELRLGLDSVVFLDDNPVERERVRTALPEVLVPELPKDKLLYARILAELDVFDAVTLSDEDRRRTRLYASERERRTIASVASSPEEYLASLELSITAEALDTANLARAAQLLNKTNQLNLRTRRLSEPELAEWARGAGHHVFTFRVKDRFDDHGLTGLASFHVEGTAAVVDDLVMSCRVLGRGVEEAILHVLVAEARARELGELVVELVPTERNAPTRTFLEEKSRLRRTGEHRFAWDLGASYAPPSYVAVRKPGE